MWNHNAYLGISVHLIYHCSNLKFNTLSLFESRECIAHSYLNLTLMTFKSMPELDHASYLCGFGFNIQKLFSTSKKYYLFSYIRGWLWLDQPKKKQLIFWNALSSPVDQLLITSRQLLFHRKYISYFLYVVNSHFKG